MSCLYFIPPKYIFLQLFPVVRTEHLRQQQARFLLSIVVIQNQAQSKKHQTLASGAFIL